MSDDRFTEQFVSSKKRKFGARKIAHELKLRGVDELIINRVLSNIKDDEFLLAKNIWEKKFNWIPTTIDEKAKQIRFMQSRGIKKNEAIIMLIYAFINEISKSAKVFHDDVIKEIEKFFEKVKVNE